MEGLSTLARRAGAVLCAALILVFTQAAVASVVGDVEHFFVGTQPHHHMLFSDISLDFDQDHHACSSDVADKDCSSGHEADHHHHHGDLGSSHLLLTIAPQIRPERVSLSDPSGMTAALTKTRSELPERPPRTGHITA